MNSRTRMRLGASALAVLIAVGVVVASHRGTPSAVTPQDTDTVPQVTLARVAFVPYTSHVRAQGRFGPPSGDEAKIAFADAGIVARIDAHVGQAVRAGDALAELDTAGLTIDVAQARSDAAAAAANYGSGTVPALALASAQARYDAARDRLRAIESGTGSAQSDREAAAAAVRQSETRLSTDELALDRAVALYAGGVAALKDVQAARAQLAFDRADADANRAKAVSALSNVRAAFAQARADLAQAQSELRTARAQVAVTAAQASSARARFEVAQRSLAIATLRAPADGIVTAILKQPGEAVDPTQPAIVIGPASSTDVTLSVAGADARKVRPGDAAVIRIASRGIIGTGHVRAVVPSVDPSTQTTTVVVAGVLPRAASGDAVEATIDVGERRGMVIPTSAIVEDPQSGKAIVFVREHALNGGATFVSREVVVVDGDDRESLVATGLHIGEQIAAQGAFDLLAPAGGE